MANSDQFQDNKTPEGKMFLVGYRKFIVALIFVLLTAWAVVWSLAIIKPSGGQVSIVIYLELAAGFFCAVFVGGNALAKLWASKYNMKTTANLSHETSQEEINETYREERVVVIDSQVDGAFADEDIPPAKPRSKK